MRPDVRWLAAVAAAAVTRDGKIGYGWRADGALQRAGSGDGSGVLRLVDAANGQALRASR